MVALPTHVVMTGPRTKLDAKIECVRDVQRWLATVNVSSGNPEVGSVREAIAVLTRVPRPEAAEVRPLLRQWGVEQRKQKKKRPLADTIRDFEEKVIEVAQKQQAVLARFLSPKGSSSAASSCSAAQPAFLGTAACRSAAVPPSANILAAHHGCPVDSGGDDEHGMTVEVIFESVRDVQRWLATVNVSSGNPKVGSVREAIAVLTRVPRPKAEDVQPLLRQSGAQQRKQNKKRPLADTIRDFEEKVIEVTQKLLSLIHI